MNTSNLLEIARSHWPSPGAAEFSVEPIEKGGSDRRFYRIEAGEAGSLIAVSYSHHREENRHYVDIAVFLAECGVRVPKIYHHDPERGLIFMEDLGERDLWHWREAPWDERRPLYFSALGEMARLHGPATRRFSKSGPRLEKEFNEQLYLWEQNYFLENCLCGVFGLGEAEARALAGGEFFREAAARLAGHPRTLVHRDFQSQNVLIHQGRACLIDFQGLRPGLPLYDLASLIYDPYVELAAHQKAELAAEYRRLAAAEGVPTFDNFEETLTLCAMQRLMQAMGAYGFLGLRLGKTGFLASVRPAGRALSDVLRRLDAPPALSEFLAARTQ
ncbi:MAG: phosphotransferase [Terrimicrobiaceae bacterium]|nr:phosphotransferase [Terrimicrobiaceae bacterium]